MTVRRPDRSRTARLVELTIADDAASWADAGFVVDHDPDGDRVRIRSVSVRLTGRGDGPGGITGWTLAGVSDPGRPDVDGLPTTFIASRQQAHDPDADADPVSATTADPTAAHPNGTTGLDHVVVYTADLERTIDAFTALQLSCRRIRDAGTGASALRQAFFRLGPTVIEVVGPATGPGASARGSADQSADQSAGQSAEEAPATWFGLALDVDDLDRSAELLGDGLGPIKPAVQRGRRIATVRNRTYDVSTAIALMDDHADRLLDDLPPPTPT